MLTYCETVSEVLIIFTAILSMDLKLSMKSTQL